MRTDAPRLLFLAAAVLLLVRAGLEAHEARRPRPASGVRWHSVQEGRREAERSGRPLLYDFSADWCRPCKRMDRELFSDETAGAWIQAGFVPVRVEDGLASDGLSDAEARALRRRFDVEAFPTLLVVEGGEVRGRQVGYRDRSTSLEFLRTNSPASR